MRPSGIGLSLALHLAVAGAALAWVRAAPPPPAAPVVMLVELAEPVTAAPTPAAETVAPTPPAAPLPAAEAPLPDDPPPASDAAETGAATEDPPPESEPIAPVPTPTPAPKPRPPPPPSPDRQQPHTRQLQTWQPQTATATTAPTVAAPAPAMAPATRPSAATLASWQALVLKRLDRVKRYPRVARLRGEEGVARLHLVIDRQGRILNAGLAASSGLPRLDGEALAMAGRVTGLPPPPADLPGNPIELVLPVAFSLR